MERKKNIAIAVLLTLFGGWAVPNAALAQHEWDNFAIGECLIVNLGDTIPKFDTSPEQISGLAYTCLISGGEITLSDPRTGQLQFVNGLNRKFEDIKGGDGTALGIWACPVPGDDSAWFCLSSWFSKIDMRGDSGLGEVTKLNENFAPVIGGGIEIVPHSDSYHYWFIAPGPFAPNANGQNVHTEFYSYLIGPDGPVLPPVVSKEPLDIGLYGFLYGSPDGSTLVGHARYDSLPSTPTGIGIFHIDQRTGQITFEHEIETGQLQFSGGPSSHLVFSRNGKALYYSAYDQSDSTSYILQYDLTRLAITDAPYVVAQSRVPIDNAFGPDMALAGNGRIYGLSNYSKTIRGLPQYYFFGINSPDSIGPACHFVDTAFGVGHTEGLAIWNGVPRVVHSTLAQIQSVSEPSCRSSCYSFTRPDSVAGFPHWSFEGGSPATATGPTAEVCFDSAGPHEVFAVTSSGDTLFTLVAAGTPSGAAHSLTTASFTISPGANITVPVELILGYVNGGPDQTGDTIGHLMQECVIQFDTSILSLPTDAATAISIPPQDEIYSARQTGGTLTLVFEDTIGSTWWPAFGTWRDTMDKISIKFRVTNSNNWQSSKITLTRFSLDGGDGSRYDFCPVEDNLLATLTNATAGVAEQKPSSPLLRIFPNPASNSITVELAGTVTIYDPLGRVYKVPIHGNTLDISSLPAGVYYLSDGSGRAKFVKE